MPLFRRRVSLTYTWIHPLISRQRVLSRSCNGARRDGRFYLPPYPLVFQRTLLREQTECKDLQIQAIGLSLYEPVPGTTAEQIGNEVIRTQWLLVPQNSPYSIH